MAAVHFSTAEVLPHSSQVLPTPCWGWQWHFWAPSPATLPQVQKAQWLLDQAEMRSAFAPAQGLGTHPTHICMSPQLVSTLPVLLACLALEVAPRAFCNPLLSPQRKVDHSDPNLLANASWQVAGVEGGWWSCRLLPAGRGLGYQIGTHGCSLKPSTTARLLELNSPVIPPQSWKLLRVVWILMQREVLRSHTHSRNRRARTGSHSFLNLCNVQIHPPNQS